MLTIEEVKRERNLSAGDRLSRIMDYIGGVSHGVIMSEKDMADAILIRIQELERKLGRRAE